MQLFLATALLLFFTHAAHACWSAIDPSAFAEDCPVILRGQDRRRRGSGTRRGTADDPGQHPGSRKS